VEGKTISDCCQACLVEATCERYVLVPADGECYLKAAIAGDLKLTGDFSGMQSGMLSRSQAGSSTTAEQAASMLDYVTVEGHALLGFALMPAAARESVAVCADWCSASVGCVSFNYNAANKLCQLSSSTKTESGGEGFEQDAGSTYNEQRLHTAPTPAPAPVPAALQLQMSEANTRTAEAELSEAQQGRSDLSLLLNSEEQQLEEAQAVKGRLQDQIDCATDSVNS
jgi:hypothetical protein